MLFWCKKCHITQVTGNNFNVSMNSQQNKSAFAATILPSRYKIIQRIIIKNGCSFLFFAFTQEGLQVFPSVLRTTTKLKYVYKHNIFTKVVKVLSRFSNS